MRCASQDPVGFSGRVFLLIDERVSSAAETFAAIAKASGWATLVGTSTRGDGLSSDPVMFALPNSCLLFRFTLGMSS